MSRQRHTSALMFVILVGILFSATAGFAQIIGADPAACMGELSVCTHHMSTYSWVSLTEGNVAETYSVAHAMSAFGPTLSFDLIYNSYNADGNRAQVDAGIGYGWTHTYNDFLFIQGNDLFRWGPDGRVTKFTHTGDSWQAAPGYFETLTGNEDGSFTITTKHQTSYRYQVAPGNRHPKGRFPANNPIYQLISITDRNNNATTLSYAGGYLSSVTDTYGRSLTLTYNANNHLASVTDPLGRVTTFIYDVSTGTQLTAITDPLGHSTSYTYDGLNQITTKTDRDGRKFSISYTSNVPISESDGDNKLIYKLANGSHWATDQNQLNQNALRVYIPDTTFENDGRAKVWNYTYDSNGFPLTILTPDLAHTTYTYDPNTLQVATRIDANGHSGSFQYDSAGNMTQSTDAHGRVTTFTYEPTFNQLTSMTDPNHRKTTYTYDSHGNRLSETDPLHQTTSMTYDGHGNVLTSTDKRGGTATYVYDAFGNRSTVTNAHGDVTQSTYDAIGNLRSLTDARGHTAKYQYDMLNRLIVQIDAHNEKTTIDYDNEGDKIHVRDREGISVAYAYDLRRRRITGTDGRGKKTTSSYDDNNNLVSVTDRNGHTTSYVYDVQNRPISKTDALGNTSSSQYDHVGNKLSDTDANGHTTAYGYDDVNRRISMTDAAGEVTTYGYDLTDLPGCPVCTGPTLGSSKITQQTDGNGKVIYWAYDDLDRLVVDLHKQGSTVYAIEPNDAATRHGYDENSNQISMTDPVGNTTTNTYDVVNRLIRTVNAAGDTSSMTYDPKGNVLTVTAPNLNVTTNSYDELDRVIQVDDEVGRVANYTYDKVGNQLTSKDGNGNGSTNTYDADYRVMNIMDALGSSTKFTYDDEGNLLTTADRMGSVTTNSYDSINQLTSKVLAADNTITYAYDPVGNLTHITDPNGNPTTYVYDVVNRPTTERFADASEINYVYDNTGHVIQRADQNGFGSSFTYSDLYYLLQRKYAFDPADNFTYDFAGRMLSAEKDGWVDTFTWDPRSFLTQTTQNGELVIYGYSIQGRERAVYYPQNATSIVESTDARGRIGQVEDVTNLEYVVAGYSYDAADNVLTRELANGVTANLTNNANNWVTKLNHNLGSTRIADFNYGYDNVGTRVSEQKLPDSSPGQTQSSNFNSLYQMMGFKSVTVSPTTKPATLVPPTTQTQITFDSVGNWSTKITDGVTETRTHNILNEIATINGVPLVYDANGNLLQDTQYTYTYNQDDQLTGVSTNTAHPTMLAQIRYDALGRRVEKIGTPVTRRYFYDGMRLIEEQDVAQNPTAAYVYGNALDELLMAKNISSGATYFYQQNALGSVSAVTNAVGTPMERYRYDAFGRPKVTDGNGTVIPPNPSGTPHSAIGNPWMFNNRFLDEETGLFDYRSRSYDTGKGRFLQQDSIGNWGDSHNIGNGYAYVGNTPTSHADPLGMAVNAYLKVDGRPGAAYHPIVPPIPPCNPKYEICPYFGDFTAAGRAASPVAKWNLAQGAAAVIYDKLMGDQQEDIWGGQDSWGYLAARQPAKLKGYVEKGFDLLKIRPWIAFQGGGSGDGGSWTNSYGGMQNSPASVLGIKWGDIKGGSTAKGHEDQTELAAPGGSGNGIWTGQDTTGIWAPDYPDPLGNIAPSSPGKVVDKAGPKLLIGPDQLGAMTALSGPRNGCNGGLSNWGSSGPASIQTGGGGGDVTPGCHTFNLPGGGFVVICCQGACCCGNGSDSPTTCKCGGSGAFDIL